LEVNGNAKHCSLLRYGNNDSGKKFYSSSPSFLLHDWSNEPQGMGGENQKVGHLRKKFRGKMQNKSRLFVSNRVKVRPKDSATTLSIMAPKLNTLGTGSFVTLSLTVLCITLNGLFVYLATECLGAP
jgi:hypothetical protein